MTPAMPPSETVESRAVWVNANTLALPYQMVGGTRAAAKTHWFSLVGHPNVELVAVDLDPTQYVGLVDGSYGGLSMRWKANDRSDAVPLPRSVAQELLRGPLTLQVESPYGAPFQTGIQIGPALDAIYGQAAATAPVGINWDGEAPTLRLWAPTALDVALLVWDEDAAPDVQPTRHRATWDDRAGTWTVVGGADWKDKQYLWEVRVYSPDLRQTETIRVTDPYSTGLTIDSKRSVLVDLTDPQWVPEGWGQALPAPLRTQAAQTLYELHVRDFSVYDETVPAGLRGTYKAFTLPDSAGVRHLRGLAHAGLTSLHLLPTFDIASSSIPENRAQQATPHLDGVPLTVEYEGELRKNPAFTPNSSAQQQAVEKTGWRDAFNWGYDPLHWGAPEGSYATEGNQVGGPRTLEYREMVVALHRLGLRVVQDVVYNHTMEYGAVDQSVLDRIVPGYYHRLDERGNVEMSTCCANIATERVMAERLMVDTLVRWARDYHIDGFRFDLMGHHSLENMQRVRAALDELTVEKDGVNGAAIYLYGEGWNFGEVANDAQFVQATQANLAGTGIGSFNDRLRDAVRGGSPTDIDHRPALGFATGEYTDPNATARLAVSEGDMRRGLQRNTKLVMLSLVGSLRDYPVPTASGPVLGKDMRYAGQPAGFAAQPAECVNYVEAHDNESLYDSNIFKLPTHADMETRIRMQVLANATVALSQSPAFFTAGTEILRSKSLDRNSFNSGDWFNGIDWEMRRNTFGTGLPVANENEAAWPIMQTLLANPTLRPGPKAMRRARDMTFELLQMRSSSALFTLGDADAIIQSVSFPNAGRTPGVLAMLIQADGAASTEDPFQQVLVVFNGTPKTVEAPVAGLAREHFELHPVQAGGVDRTVQSSKWDYRTGSYEVPGRTVAVFIQPKSA